MSGAVLHGKVMEYVQSEEPPDEVAQESPYGPFGLCWRNRRITTSDGKPDTIPCWNPAETDDLGLCGDCLAELVAG